MTIRLLTVGIVAASLAGAACNRTEPAANAASKSAQPGAALTAEGTPAATSGTVAPTWREVTIPAGTPLPIILDTTVGSDISRVEEPVHAHLSRAVMVGDQTALPSGSAVTGVVTDATRSAKVKGLAHVGVRFDTIVPQGEDERYRIDTASVGRTAPATKKKDAVKIGAPAAGGAIIGAIVGGKKGAVVGTAVGGGAGTAVVLSTRGKEVRLSKGAALTLRLAEPLTIRIRG